MPRFFAAAIAIFVVADAQCVCCPAGSRGLDFFEKKIRPVLVEHCYECHSQEAKKVRGGLLLDTRAGLLKGGDSGPRRCPRQAGQVPAPQRPPPDRRAAHAANGQAARARSSPTSRVGRDRRARPAVIAPPTPRRRPSASPPRTGTTGRSARSPTRHRRP